MTSGDTVTATRRCSTAVHRFRRDCRAFATDAGPDERKEHTVTYHHHHGLNGCKWCEERHGLWGAFALGLAVFILGTILMLDNFGVIDAGAVAPYWPLLLVVLGASHLVPPTSVRRSAGGLSWIAIGAIILLHNLDAIPVGIETLWPVVLVIFGGSLLLRFAVRRFRGVEDSARSGSDSGV